MGWKLLFAFSAATLAIFLGVMDISGDDAEFEEAKESIVMRKIGHEILLHAGDSVSRVLPVQRIKENKYQIQFESAFTFEPDSLVEIIRQTINNNKLNPHYIVNVIECSGQKVVFGYAMLGTEETNIIPCSGRKQPESCYFITLTFQSSSFLGIPKEYFTSGAGLLSFGLVLSGLSIYYKRKVKRQQNSETAHNKYIPIGNFHFYSEKRCLRVSGKQIDLTIKESKLLAIFANSPNQVIHRNRLQKEIWEDEGIIVGRSLDMFVSKLRKKLDDDPRVNLVNVHSKGYILEIN